MKPDNAKPWGHKTEFAAFHKRHGRKWFTPTWNTTVEADMRDKSLPKEARVLMAIRRYSWGNLSDFAVDCMPPKKVTDQKQQALSQERLGEMLGLRPASMSEACTFLKDRGYLRKNHLFLYPEDEVTVLDSANNLESDSNSTNFDSPFVRFERDFLEHRPELRTTLSSLDAERKRLQEDAKKKTLEINKIKRLVLSAWRDTERDGDTTRLCAHAQNEMEEKTNCTSEYLCNLNSNSAPVSFATPKSEFDPSRTVKPTNQPVSNRTSEALLNLKLLKKEKRNTTTTEIPVTSSPSSSPTDVPEEFRIQLAGSFTRSHKPAPLSDQATAAYYLLLEDWKAFVEWLPGAPQWKRTKHPGGLPSLIRFFYADRQPAAAPADPETMTKEEIEDYWRACHAKANSEERADIEKYYPELFNQEVTRP